MADTGAVAEGPSGRTDVPDQHGSNDPDQADSSSPGDDGAVAEGSSGRAYVSNQNGSDDIDHAGNSSSRPTALFQIFSRDQDDNVIRPLNTAARNELVRQNPHLIAGAIAQRQREIAQRTGSYRVEDCLIFWNESHIPFHMEYTARWQNDACHHLVSVRNRSLNDPVRYAIELMPLAKPFLLQSIRSNQSHLPFTRRSNQGHSSQNTQKEEETTRQTIEHANIIISQYTTLYNVDIQMAEVTAKLVNAGKILLDLLLFLTCPTMNTDKPAADDTKDSPKNSTKQNQAQGLVESYTSTDIKKPPAQFSEQSKEEASSQDTGSGTVIASESINKTDAVESAVPSMGSSPDTPRTANKKKAKGSAQRRRAAQRRVIHAPGPVLKESKSSDRASSPKDKEAATTQPALDVVNEQVPEVIKRSSERSVAVETHAPDIGTTSAESDSKPDVNLSESAIHGVSGSQDDATDDESTPRASPPRSDITLIPGRLSDSFAIFDPSHPDPFAIFDDPSIDTVLIKAKRPVGSFAIVDPFARDDDPSFDSGYRLIAPGVLRVIRLLQKDASTGIEFPWTYATYTPVDLFFNKMKIFMWEEMHGYFQLRSRLRARSSGYAAYAPVIIYPGNTGTHAPLMAHNGDKVIIVPHAIPWPDTRYMPGHPDFLTSSRLAEYQACEAAGYPVRRHDRLFFQCRIGGCEARIPDQQSPGSICFGCGPKTKVRYCSFQHQVEDVENHWYECGHPDLLMKCIIDHTTAHPAWALMIPAIKEKHGIRSPYRHTQRLYAIYSYGHYTLFEPFNQFCKTLYWPKTNPKRKDMDSRIERILNVAFLNACDGLILSYLYRLLRELLYQAGELQSHKWDLLNIQFAAEFGTCYFNPYTASRCSLCECEWIGKDFQHIGYTRCSLPRHDFGPKAPRFGLKAYVEQLEHRYWILRAWQQQHPTEEDWRRRAVGHGFPKFSPRVKTFELGPGWTGWGGKEDDLCSGH